MHLFFTKYFFSLISVVIASIFLVSCAKNTESSTEQEPQKDSTISTTEAVISTSQSELLKLIINPQGGDFRGLSLGDALNKIKSQEKFELFEDSTDHVGFTYETENFEAIDILYFLDKNQTLSSIRVEIYLNDGNAVQNLSEQFKTYFSGKYTLENAQDKGTHWQSKKGILVFLEDVSKGKDYGLRLGIWPKGSKSMIL